MFTTQKELKPVSIIFHYLNRYRWPMIAGLFYIAAATAFQLLSPWVLRYAIDYIAAAQRGSIPATFIPFASLKLSAAVTLLIYSCIIVGATVIHGLFRYLMRNTMIGASRRIEYELRNDYFSHLQKLSQTYFHRHQTGDLMARATNDLEAVRAMLGPGIMHFATTVFVAIATIVLMFKLSCSLTLWSLLPMPLIAILANRLLAQIDRLWGLIQANFSGITAKVEENLSGIRVVKSYVREDYEINAFQEINREYIKRNMDLARVQSFLRSGIQFLLGIGIIIVLFAGGSKVMHDTLSIGSLVSFLAYYNILAWPMIALGWTLNLWQQGLASLRRMMDIWSEKPEIADSTQTNPAIRSIKGQIEFRDVTFGYDKDKPILRNINLTIPAGQTLAIVGPTGSGKSSLVHLIPRMYDVQSGAIFIDGHEIGSIPLKILRSHIGYVPQETFLFSDTLQENIAFGIQDPSMDALDKATVISQLKVDFDQFSDGLQTLVGERGLTLSGGQKQRTAISRAVIKKPEILILDDALSAVDTYTEEEILRQLKGVMKNCTSIIISHRISTVRHADRIIVLDNGKIIEQGKHAALLKKHGLYYRLYQRQLLEKTLEQL